MISREKRGEIVVLQLDHGKANALDVELLRALSTAVEAGASDAAGVVLTGRGGMFSAGLDLPLLVDSGPEYTFELIDALNELLWALVDLEIPTVAAVNGHAIAGGFLVAAACDVRVQAAGPGKLGLTELLLGVPLPPLALEIVRMAVGDRNARRMVLHGELFSTDRSEALGLIDELVEPERLLDRAVAIAERLGAVPRSTFALTKRQLLAPLRLRLENLGEAHEQSARQVWVAPATARTMSRFVRERLG